MSRVYFHSPTGDAELHGSERAYLGHVAEGPARAAWNIDLYSDVAYAADILAMVPEVDDGEYGANYLHNYLREAQAEDQRYSQACTANPASGRAGLVRYNPEPAHRLNNALQRRVISGTTFRVVGVDLNAGDIAMNTALAVGADVIRLAAKISGWCEAHAWVDGPDRAWLADLIDDGLRIGVYRRTLRGISQGWEDVQALLRADAVDPVVMSYSVSDRFPNADTAGWSRHLGVRWEQLTDTKQWDAAMSGLRRDAWKQITPGSLAATTFGPGVTVYDLLAPDRDDRVRAAVAAASG